MKKLFIFPFTPVHLPLLRYSADLDSDMVVIPMLPPSIDKNVNDLSYLDNRGSTMCIRENIFSANDSDIFCIVSGSRDDASLLYANKIAEDVLGLGFSVYDHLTQIERKKLFHLNTTLKSSKKIIKSRKNVYSVNLFKNEQPSLIDIKPTIIVVGSIVAHNDKSEVCLAIRKHLRSKGENVIYISCDSVYSYLSCFSIDYDQLYQNGIDYMIFYINYFVNKLAQEYNATTIIVESPDSLLKYNESYLGRAGVLTYIVSQALRIDLLVCCSPLTYNSEKYYSEMSTYLCRKFDAQNVLFHMSNFFVEEDNIPYNQKVPGCYISEREYNQIYSSVKSSAEDSVYSPHNLTDVDVIRKLF